MVGTRERRVREKQALRQQILESAREIARHDGWQSVTIRRIAQAIEYSPPTIYEYFASKDDILLELMRLGFSLLLEGNQQARSSSFVPSEQIKAICFAWWRFAWEYPDLYQVLHGLAGVDFLGGDENFPEGIQAFMICLEILKDFASSEDLALPEPELVGQLRILWATMHGLVSLTMGERIGKNAEDIEPLVLQAAQNFLAALRTLYKKAS